MPPCPDGILKYPFLACPPDAVPLLMTRPLGCSKVTVRKSLVVMDPNVAKLPCAQNNYALFLTPVNETFGLGKFLF